MRSRPGKRTVAIAAVTVASLVLVVPADATPPAKHKGSSVGKTQAPSVRPGSSRPDRSFGPSERRAEIKRQQRLSDDTADRLGLGVNEELVVKDVVRDADGTEHVRYDRTYDGLPVIGGDMVVERATDGALQATRATNARIRVRSTTPRVSAGDAKARATTRTDGRASAKPPVKVVFAARHRPVLAWQTTVTGTESDGTPVRDLVYTNASTGKQLLRLPQIMDARGRGRSLYSGRVRINTVQSGSTYQLVDRPRGGHRTYTKRHRCCSSRGVLVTDRNNRWGNGKITSTQSAAVDAAYGAAQTWNFYMNGFGRDGIANNGRAAYSRVHFRKHYDNAFWDDGCFCMTYGDGGRMFRPLVELDVAGHEMTHGVTSATAGLFYEGESGGLNESTSDVMGTMVEFTAKNAKDRGDYLLGEKIVKRGGPLRRMDRPRADGHSANCWSTFVGSRDVHYSSGVGNHLFYLLAAGTGTKRIGGKRHSSVTCNGTSLTGIGRAKAASIWYRALTTYWTSTTDYHRAANGMVGAARDLYGDGSAECAATVRAWKGVSVTPDVSCSAPTTDPSNLLRNPGFEQGKTAWGSTRDVINDDDVLARSGNGLAYLDGYGETHTDQVTQQVTVPAAGTAALTFYLDIATDDSPTVAHDVLEVQARPHGTATYTTLKSFSNRDAGSTYQLRSVDLSDYTGQEIDIRFVGRENANLATDFFLDDLSLTTG